jgi:hypothetical protein
MLPCFGDAVTLGISVSSKGLENKALGPLEGLKRATLANGR